MENFKQVLFLNWYLSFKFFALYFITCCSHYEYNFKNACLGEAAFGPLCIYNAIIWYENLYQEKVIETAVVAYVDCDLFRSSGTPHSGCFH